MYRSVLILAFLLSLLASSTAQGQRTETRYQPRAETSYKAQIKAQAALGSTETAYNPKGTYSAGNMALLSTRRDSPEYAAFQLGMQAAAIADYRQPLNVAPAAAVSLSEQASALVNPDIRFYIVDAPDPGGAQEFFERSKLLGRSAVLISSRLPTGYYPPVVVDSPILQAERAGEEAIRFVGNVDVEVAYILGETESDKMRENLLRSFKKPFNASAPKIKVSEIDPSVYTPGLVPPQVVCVLANEDSRRHAPVLKKKFPDSKIICVGESPETIAAFENELIDIRIRPDYRRLLGNALKEAQKKSDMPIIIHPTMDKHWDAAED